MFESKSSIVGTWSLCRDFERRYLKFSVIKYPLYRSWKASCASGYRGIDLRICRALSVFECAWNCLFCIEFGCTIGLWSSRIDKNRLGIKQAHKFADTLQIGTIYNTPIFQETLSAQLRAQHLDDLDTSNESTEETAYKKNLLEPDLLSVEEFRSTRSNSMYTRAGNEALTALRHR
jgi:hypothetical protein